MTKETFDLFTNTTNFDQPVADDPEEMAKDQEYRRKMNNALALGKAQMDIWDNLSAAQRASLQFVMENT